METPAGKQLLVVEDEAVVRMDIVSRLEKMGYKVVESVPDGESAIEAAESKKPDLVLMDIRLQGRISGVMASQTIRERFQIPIVYLTAFADDETFGQAKLTHPYAFVIKPFTDRELSTSIEIALIHSKQERLLEDKNKELLDKNKRLQRLLEERVEWKERYKELRTQMKGVSALLTMAGRDVKDPAIVKSLQRIQGIFDRSLTEADAQFLPEIDPLLKA